MSKPESLLVPLPSLNLVTNVEKLDAGLRDLDHCELSLTLSLVTYIADLSNRPDEAPIMALHTPSTTHSFSTLGDTAFSSHPEEHSISSSRHVLLNNGKPRNSYFLHGSLTNSFLVRLHKSRKGHGTRACFRSLL